MKEVDSKKVTILSEINSTTSLKLNENIGELTKNEKLCFR